MVGRVVGRFRAGQSRFCRSVTRSLVGRVCRSALGQVQVDFVGLVSRSLVGRVCRSTLGQVKVDL